MDRSLWDVHWNGLGNGQKFIGIWPELVGCWPELVGVDLQLRCIELTVHVVIIWGGLQRHAAATTAATTLFSLGCAFCAFLHERHNNLSRLAVQSAPKLLWGEALIEWLLIICLFTRILYRLKNCNSNTPDGVPLCSWPYITPTPSERSYHPNLIIKTMSNEANVLGACM